MGYGLFDSPLSSLVRHCLTQEVLYQQLSPIRKLNELKLLLSCKAEVCYMFLVPNRITFPWSCLK